ncbi:5936_t:CDS:2 [Funneliformis mosseae]|uniref:5936_t:CDS:1 n=1 Tax=Funneliformis mosseae TaxID=27381 RepID=A0A9N8WAK5_FUNMO|nr:5936_t:CDS:2 [Funneliformis mosseae]
MFLEILALPLESVAPVVKNVSTPHQRNSIKPLETTRSETTLAKDYSALIVKNFNLEFSGIFDEEDMNPHARFTETDYVMAIVINENELFSYFDSAFLRNWANPEHWKIKITNKNKGTSEIEGEKDRSNSKRQYEAQPEPESDDGWSLL